MPVLRPSGLLALLAAFATSWSVPAIACPSCPTARAVRASVYDASFWSNLALVLLPLIVLLAWCRRLYGIGLESGRKTLNAGVDP